MRASEREEAWPLMSKDALTRPLMNKTANLKVRPPGTLSRLSWPLQYVIVFC